VFVAIPESAGRGALVVVSSVTVTGLPVTGGQALPARMQLVRGMHAPLRIVGAANRGTSSPVITLDGVIYIPLGLSETVLVFDADGAPLSPLPLAAMGLSDGTHFADFIEATGTLLLADTNDASSKLVAIDAVSGTVRWSAALGSSCWGIAALPTQGVVVVSDYDDNQLHVHRLSDGVRVLSTTAVSATCVAADPAFGTVYVSTGDYGVSVFRWDGAALVAEGVVKAAGTGVFDRHLELAVMPPTPGRHTSYLIVGTHLSTLHVLSLPDRRLVHTHTLEGIDVMGLAADPSGTAFAVCDGSSEAIHVLPWPLPGMPPLQ
jgi:hypothetical protein